MTRLAGLEKNYFQLPVQTLNWLQSRTPESHQGLVVTVSRLRAFSGLVFWVQGFGATHI